ncbi:predicted protein [Naegleria gruberi]|uniref:Predicted protein n=1 Tax=Naegleria gruberi TaxID=5762 RepID=D2V5K0_NAEGR|nr:uncharacterized protein NAEGRDRAFT_78666 [Naegleria gruberi]EFC47811.1 predicted protein [Naegleria gruberi]|eukprot:XP_002680555.1 predicted protein [Naegleria gruberi strain NEG-M]
MHFSHLFICSFCILLIFISTTVFSQNCFIEKDGMIIDFSKADNGTTGHKIIDTLHLPGNYYMLNLCKPVTSTNASCYATTNQGQFQIAFIDNYFDRCFGIGKPGPRISLFDPKHIQNGVIVEFDMFVSLAGELHGAKCFLVCDEDSEFKGFYIGTSKKTFKKEFTHEFKIVTRYACPRKKENNRPVKILSKN